MGFRVHIRVHTHGHRGNDAQLACDLGQDTHLGLAFQIELANAIRQRQTHFIAGFANAREHDPVTRHACRNRTAVFPTGHDVHARTHFAQQFQHGEVRVRLDRETDKMVSPVQRFVE